LNGATFKTKQGIQIKLKPFGSNEGEKRIPEESKSIKPTISIPDELFVDPVKKI
jgi:hypothetical protein